MELPSKTISKTRQRLSDGTIRYRNQKWFNDFYFLQDKPRAKYAEYHQSRFNFVIGKIYTFLYFDPKYKEELDFYNAVPVGIFIGHNKSSGHPMFLALQFIPPQIRIQVLDKIVKYNKGHIEKSLKYIRKSGLSQRQLNTKYSDLKTFLTKSGFEFAIRSYIVGRIQSRPRIITFWDWWRLGTFSGQFMMKQHIITIYNSYKRQLQ